MLYELRNLNLFYQAGEKPALRDLTFSVREHEFLLVVGGSGAGKSTLLQLLAGLIPRQVPARVAGEASYRGGDLLSLPQITLSTEIGIIFQDPDAQLCMLTVEDEIAFGCENLGLPRDEIKRRVEHEVSSFGLDALRGERTDSLSGGEKQMVILASILAMSPKVLVLDEPTSNLDCLQYEGLVRRIGEIHAQGTSIIVVDHKSDAWLPWATRIIGLRDGELILDGPAWTTFESNVELFEEMGVSVPEIISCRRQLAIAGLLSPDEIAQTAEGLSSALRRQGWKLSTRLPRLTCPETAEPVISLKGVAYSYKHSRMALGGIDLSIPRGMVLALVGPNGSGKTTLAKLMAGILEPDEGVVLVQGREITSYRSPMHAGIGFLFQRSENQLFTETVREELELASRDAGSGWTADALLDGFGLRDLSARHPWDLSQGQKRKVAISAAFPFATVALILDEPTMGLDYHSLELLRDTLRIFRERGVTVVFASHELRFALECATHIAVLGYGRIVCSGPSGSRRVFQSALREARLQCPVPDIACHLLPKDLAVDSMLPVTVDELCVRLSGGSGLGRVV